MVITGKLPNSIVELLTQILDRKDWTFNKVDAVETASIPSNEDESLICNIRWFNGSLSTINFLDVNHTIPSVIISYQKVLNAGLADKVKALRDDLLSEYQEPNVDVNNILSKFVPE